MASAALFVVLAACCSVAYGTLTVVPVTESTVFVGETLKLNCATDLTVANPIRWSLVNFTSRLEADISNGTQTTSSRYFIENTQPGSYNLVVNSTVFDDGSYQYQCVENTANGQKMMTNVSVLVAELTLNTTGIIEENDLVNISCSFFFNGFAAANLTMIVVRPRANSTSTMQLPGGGGAGMTSAAYVIVTEPEIGPCYCNVSFRTVTTEASRAMTIESQPVLYPVRDVTINASIWSAVHVGDVIRCSAVGYPEPAFYWTQYTVDGSWDVIHNGSLLTPSVPGSYKLKCTAVHVINDVSYNATSPSADIVVYAAVSGAATWSQTWIRMIIIVVASPLIVFNVCDFRRLTVP